METYKVRRFYQREDVPTRTIKTGLTLEQAQAHCDDPETSSSTTTTRRDHTDLFGPWFDGYEVET